MDHRLGSNTYDAQVPKRNAWEAGCGNTVKGTNGAAGLSSHWNKRSLDIASVCLAITQVALAIIGWSNQLLTISLSSYFCDPEAINTRPYHYQLDAEMHL